MDRKRIKGYTLKEAQEELEVWKDAKRNAATGKSYQIAGRSLTRYDLSEINREIEFFSGIINSFHLGSSGPIRVIARMRR